MYCMSPFVYALCAHSVQYYLECRVLSYYIRTRCSGPHHNLPVVQNHILGIVGVMMSCLSLRTSHT